MIHDTRYKIQDTRYKIQDTRYKIQDIKYKYLCERQFLPPPGGETLSRTALPICSALSTFLGCRQI